MPLATHNVIGAFSDRSRAEAAVETLEAEGIPRASISLNGRDDEELVAKAEMREEAERSVTGLPFGAANPEQSKGAALWTVVGTAVGAIVGLLIGWLFFGGAAGIVISLIAFAVAGATAGFIAGGFVPPRAVEHARDARQARRIDVGIHSQDQGQVEKAQDILRTSGADTVERFDREGNPLPELHERSGYEAAPSQTGRRLEISEEERKKRAAD